MDETETVVTQLGLLLTQTRFARRALEDVERATATFGTFAFTSVIAAGPRFGEPPLYGGALKVHVVNLADLAPGGGVGDFLQGLLGGLGSFVGNIPGGLIGGTFGTVELIAALPRVNRIVDRVVRILELLGVGAPKQPPAASGNGTAPAPPAMPPGAAVGETLTSQLATLNRVVTAGAALFAGAAGRPDVAGATDPLGAASAARWQRLVDGSTLLLTALSRVADGLVIAIPLAVGALAWLLDRLPELRNQIAETLRFLLQVAFLVRGAVLVTAFDTLAMLARVGSGVVGQLAGTVDAALAGLFGSVRAGLTAALELGGVLGDATKAVLDKLLNWLVPTVDAVLRHLADLRAFRVITHLVRVLPAVLPPIMDLAGKQLSDTAREDLHQAALLGIIAPLTPGSEAGASPTVPAAPDLRAVLRELDTANKAAAAFDALEKAAKATVSGPAGTLRTGLDSVARTLDSKAAAEVDLSETTLDRHLATIRTQSTDLAAALVAPEPRSRPTGLEPIAAAYEGWLTAGGLDTLLTAITRHFSGEPGRAGVPARVVEGTFDRPRATVVIDEVVVEVTGPAGGPAPPAAVPVTGPPALPETTLPEPDLLDRMRRWQSDTRLRGDPSPCW